MEITFEIEPDDGGHHVPVGKDRMTYLVSYGPEVQLIDHTHLATYDLPVEPTYKNPKALNELNTIIQKKRTLFRSK